ncbi:hypothetical protein SAMN05421855_10398 [Ulvibacter litoralis]|uniref:Uncharacterized protein n=1 Tax=Ulvibacter litoralis TaxID=227084 RepID=A0A1G7GF27_9FLAO|nr:hypothetical protein SAMN05421855_10398 [Ulvibacter litoralis]
MQVYFSVSVHLNYFIKVKNSTFEYLNFNII